MFVVVVDQAGDAFTSVVGEHNIYQVAGFVNARLNALVEQYEAASTEGGDGKETINEPR